MFNEDIARSMGPVLKADGYKMILLDRYRVYFIKRYSDKLGFYVVCKDMGNEGYDIELCFRPIDMPDDRMLDFWPGLQILFSTFYLEKSDESMIIVAKKLLATEKIIGNDNVSATILQELQEPYELSNSILTRRMGIYQRVLCIYDTIKSDESIQQEFKILMENVCKCLKGKTKNDRKAFQLGKDFINNLPEDYFKNKGIELQFEGVDLGGSFSSYIYAQCVLDA